MLASANYATHVGIGIRLSPLLQDVDASNGRRHLPSNPTTYKRNTRRGSQVSGRICRRSCLSPASGRSAMGRPRSERTRHSPSHCPPLTFAPLAGTFRRVGDTITVTPAADFALRLQDGSRLDGETQVQSVLAGPYRLEVTDVGDDRRWVAAIDTAHPAITTPPPLPSYPLDEQWRVRAVRLVRFAETGAVPDVRGGSMEVTAVGQLVFRLKGEELRLTAIGPVASHRLVQGPDERLDDLSRVPAPSDRSVVEDGEWTVLDFNFSYNPPCAYSNFTTCPLPPPENRLPVAIEAGLKQLPSAEGY